MEAQAESLVDLPSYWLDPDESWNLFDAEVRRQLGISGDEFIARLRSGEYSRTADDLEHARLTYLIALSDSVRD